uniref:Protein YIPF5 homolog n=1 Tax=Rhizophora mucronata TaxID=61149 RepID=A0A2P2JCU2_RHIMU
MEHRQWGRRHKMWRWRIRYQRHERDSGVSGTGRLKRGRGDPALLDVGASSCRGVAAAGRKDYRRHVKFISHGNRKAQKKKGRKIEDLSLKNTQ